MRKLETTVTINKPAKDVWEYMDNPDNLPKWLDTLERYEHVSGEMGQVGSKGRQHYIENGRPFVMEEEIVEVRKPEYMKMVLTSKPMDMVVENYFESPDKNTTKFTAIAEFTRVSLFMRLMMALFMRSSKAQKQHEDQINKLKMLVEAEG